MRKVVAGVLARMAVERRAQARPDLAAVKAEWAPLQVREARLWEAALRPELSAVGPRQEPLAAGLRVQIRGLLQRPMALRPLQARRR